MKFEISKSRFEIAQKSARSTTCHCAAIPPVFTSRQSSIILLAALFLFTALPAFAQSPSDTVVLGVEGNESFERYVEDGYPTATSMSEALDLFPANLNLTRLLILKNAASVTGNGEPWPFTAGMTTPPGSLDTIEGGSLQPWQVILQGDGNNPMFNLTSDLTIVGITIISGKPAVRAGGSAALTLEQCYIRENAGHGVVAADSATVNATNCVFYKNMDGVRVESSSANVTVTHCTFYDSQAGGNGIYVAGGCSVTATNSLMCNNEYGIRVEATGAATLSGCNSWNNTNNQNYEPATLQDTGDNYSLETLFDTTSPPWQGRLSNTVQGLVTNQAIKIGETDTGVELDFEGQGRGDPPYIGADELYEDGSIGFWSECEVYYEPIGRNGARVVIEYSETIEDPSRALYLVPQGVGIGETAYHIVVPLEGGDGVYWGNTGPIDTILGDAEEKTYFADGLGAFILRPGGGAVLDDGDEGKYIIGDAIPGRKNVLVDTITPVLDIAVASNPTVTWAGDLGESYAALGVNGLMGVDPAYPYPPVSGPQATGNTAYATVAPGADPNAPPEHLKLIYNIGSFANGYYTGLGQAIAIRIDAVFKDRDVYDVYGAESPGSRPVSGFGTYDFVGPPEAASSFFTKAGWNPQTVPAAWLVEGSLPGGTTVDSLSCAPDGTVTWFVTIPVATGMSMDSFNLIGDLVAADLAGNHANPSTIDRSVLPPLQISYLGGYGTQVNFRTRISGAWPEVAWSLNDNSVGVNLYNELNPRPLYAYRLWGARSYGSLSADPVYEPLTGWSGWAPGPLGQRGDGLPASFFDPNINNQFSSPITDRWLILVVAGCDEAGNVTPWDGYQFDGMETPTLQLSGTGTPNDPADDYITLLDGSKKTGRNWVRFYVPGETTQIDTVLYANIYYQDDATGQRKDLGPAPIVSYPPPGVSLFAEFNARLLVNDPSLWSSGEVGLAFEAQENGLAIFPSPGYRYETTGMDIVSFRLPYDDLAGSLPPRLGDPGNVMTYGVKATTVVNRITEDAITDQTPATFSFKVVPGSVDEYLRRAGGQQPVKQFEAR